MIAIAKPSSPKQPVPRWHKKFLVMLPLIRRHAQISFRQLDAEARNEAVQEVIANALVAFHRLVELGKIDVAFPSPLARYGVAQVRAGRRVGASLNCKDISSLHCQKQNRLTLERLDFFDTEEMSWTEVLIEDRTAGPAETAASRIDFASWLRSLSGQKRKVATMLATGESTQKTARKFNLSPGRVSQLRSELKDAWETFVGDCSTPEAA
ncbi:MAG: hypothetical protein K8T91_10810 [Planctomycetes bacterium]|nr:hypothetical protein [Planctomycetota bacterium]